jgi:hypothetical protein
MRNGSNWDLTSRMPRKFLFVGDPKISQSPDEANPCSAKNLMMATTLFGTFYEYFTRFSYCSVGTEPLIANAECCFHGHSYSLQSFAVRRAKFYER